MFKYQSGRVIALGRAMLALLFLISIWLDSSQPAQAPAQTYGVLLFYVVFSLGIVALTWRNWWLDARLAAPIHLLDMAIFTAIVFSTNGYTSPFFLFFILPLLSAAIRWGWRETLLTAVALVLLYLSAGLLVAGSQTFELQRFIVRSGHLVILSAVLIWFGIHQQFARLSASTEDPERRQGRDEDPLAQALALAMYAAEARFGALLLKVGGEVRLAGLRAGSGSVKSVRIDSPLWLGASNPALLFDLKRNHALAKRPDGWFRFLVPARIVDCGALSELGAVEGVICEVRTSTDAGWLVLWDIADLSVDFLELGIELGEVAGAVLERDALLSAIEEGAAARTRLSLARDVHDSVVQFLAGAAFRVEAIMRGSRSGGEAQAELKELKRLLIEEQGEIRAFVSALRRDRELDLAEAVEELRALALRLGQQWSVECHVDGADGADGDASIPIRLQLDLQQLLREAVANAVRHGGASRIDIGVGIDSDRVCLEVHDNGTGFISANGRAPVEPWSLKERVDRANGELSLFSEPGRTNIVITLPLNGSGA